MAQKIPIADDDQIVHESLGIYLKAEGFETVDVFDGEAALQNLSPDVVLCVLDIMMPKMNGFEVLKILRKEGCKTPVLFLTAKSEIEDRIQGLDLGADDYLPKPFHMGELLARVKAMLRRRDTYVPDILSYQDITLNPNNYQLSCGERSVMLPKLEYLLMETLLLNQGIYLSSEDLLIKVWGYDTKAELGIVWVYISYLRKKLLLLGSKTEICAKRGVGYTLETKK